MHQVPAVCLQLLILGQFALSAILDVEIIRLIIRLGLTNYEILVIMQCVMPTKYIHNFPLYLLTLPANTLWYPVVR